jgi:hypothetical protein
MILIFDRVEIIGEEFCWKSKREIEFYYLQKIMFKGTMGKEA